MIEDFKRIWLQKRSAGPDVGRTWCQDQIEDDDTEYVRADLYAGLRYCIDNIMTEEQLSAPICFGGAVTTTREILGYRED